MSIRRNSACLLVLVWLCACSDHPDQTWIAEETIAVYDSVDGQVRFHLQPQDRCQPGIDIAGKVDMYTRVNCNSGEGWVKAARFRKEAIAPPRATH